MQYTIEEIAHVIGAHIVSAESSSTDTQAHVNWLLTDSRSLCFPEETLFFALKTQRNDGHLYIPELQRRGVKFFVVTDDYSSLLPSSCTEDGSSLFLVVDDTLQALQTLSAYHRQQFHIPVIAITGSNGKTTVKEWLYQLLSPDYNVSRSPRSYNSQVGVPLSLWLITPHTDIAIIEAGISYPGEMQQLSNIIRPTMAVITNVGQAHQENFLSYDIKCTEKMKLLQGCRQAVVNMSDNCIARCSSALPEDVALTTWNTKTHPQSRRREDEKTSKQEDEKAHVGNASIIVRSVEKDINKATVKLSVNDELVQYTIPFIDDAAIQNSVTCFSTCVALMGTSQFQPRISQVLTDSQFQISNIKSQNSSLEVLCQRMSKLEPVAMRLEVKDGRNGCTLINDTYNSDVHSLDIALDFMSRRPDQQQTRTLILSDILQTGQSPRSLYSRVAQMVAQRGINKLIGVGEEISACADYFPMECHFFHTSDELLQSNLFAQLHDEFILIKGARQFHFDQLSDQLSLKVHQTILEVNLNALIDNLNHYKQMLRPHTKITCMVKADAYGIGAVEAAKTLQQHGVDYLAVAVADEGVQLRKAGITANIMVMNPETTSFKLLFDYRLEPEVFNFQILDALIRAAEKEGITNFPVHIKLDTGMHRLGFDPDKDMTPLIERLRRQSALTPCSVFSHFVGSDDDGFDDFSVSQFQRFDRASRQLQQAYSHHIIRHICNSAAIEHFPQYHLDMVRLGLGLYGIDPRTNQVINNVATLRTTILQIRDVPAGDTIGYSRRTQVNTPTRVAAIPIGYADGLNRRLGNRNCHCIVHDLPAPYLGNICMDVCMIDVTHIDCKEGDTVTIFGNQLPVTTLSDAIGTIPYEILTAISPRVQRIYVQE